jgi:hypothetical protein
MILGGSIMFEIGKKYEIYMVDGVGHARHWITVEKYEHPLIKTAAVIIDEDSKFYVGSGPMKIPSEIINVSSAHFIKAILKED